MKRLILILILLLQTSLFSISNSPGNEISIKDASGNVIGSSQDADGDYHLNTAQGSNPLGQVDFDVPFNNGLTIVITNNVGVTVVYE